MAADELEIGVSLAALTKYAQEASNAQMRAYMDALGRDAPPRPPPPWYRRAGRKIARALENARENFADNLRAIADRVDPWA